MGRGSAITAVRLSPGPFSPAGGDQVTGALGRVHRKGEEAAADAKLGSDLRVTSAASDSHYPSLSWTGSEFGMSWWDFRDGNYEIYFARISGVCP